MNLDDLSVEIRPRRPWEAVDLGILMAREWFWPMFIAASLLSFPFFLFLQLLLPALDLALWWVIPVFWLSKPLWERACLHILSQAVFGRVPGLKETIVHFPRLAGRQILQSLFWRRLSPSRSFLLAVTQLEGLAGNTRRKRIGVLARNDASPAGWLTLIGVHIESFLSVSFYSLIFMLIPAPLSVSAIDFFTLLDVDFGWIIQNFVTWLCFMLVMPFYVAAGFSLYLNRRSKLEGWDIEIAFRRIAARTQEQHQSKLGSAVA